MFVPLLTNILLDCTNIILMKGSTLQGQEEREVARRGREIEKKSKKAHSDKDTSPSIACAIARTKPL